MFFSILKKARKYELCKKHEYVIEVMKGTRNGKDPENVISSKDVVN